ncbi:GGDEF domain-containing protein [Streptomyces venezuelae]|uniref:GGDEF domain-containing protein n=1 Tax=Streptomyces venezuelae TaxID=54571 RepID=UPI0029585BF9|nr:GGDEF domain-containing protein [Streptomyces venezuelae]
MTALSVALPLTAGWSLNSLWLRRRIKDTRHDPLTGLWTRAEFEKRACKSLARGKQRAVLLLDLNWFKQINDTYGHATGDAVLRATGLRLGAWADAHHGVAGRLGGDEFAALVDVGGTSDTGTGNLNAKLLNLIGRLEQPVIFEGRVIDVHVSIGAARSGRADLSALLRLADEHMYRIKQEGGGFSIAPAREHGPALGTVNGRRAGRPGTHCTTEVTA